jgi:hypothetical protein
MIALILAAAVVLTPALENWKQEIEEKSGARVYVALVDYSAEDHAFTLEADVEGRALFADNLRMEAFRAEFAKMNAAMVYRREAPAAYLVMLNGALKPEWGGHEQAIVGHELGHAWLRVEGYPTPIPQNGPLACLAIHTGDAVAHVLIRAEMERRNLDYKAFWRRMLEHGSEELEKVQPPGVLDGCARLALAEQAVDLRLGWREGEWEGTARWLAALKRAYPDVLPVADELAAYLASHDVKDKDEFRRALRVAFEKFRSLFSQTRED